MKISVAVARDIADVLNAAADAAMKNGEHEFDAALAIPSVNGSWTQIAKALAEAHARAQQA